MSNDINRRVAEKVMGLTLKPDLPHALVEVARKWLFVTGYPMTLKDGSIVACPPGEQLPTPYPDARWNDRYLYYIGQEMVRRGNAEFIADVDAYEIVPPDYSTDSFAVFGSGGVVEKMTRRGYRLELVVPPGEGLVSAIFTARQNLVLNYHYSSSTTEAICLAALAVLGVLGVVNG